MMRRTRRTPLYVPILPFPPRAILTLFLLQDPRAQRSDASDDDGSSGDSESESGEEGSDDDEAYSSDEASFPRTPTKSRKRTSSQLPTPSSSSRRT